jgi:hypothetical protein
LHLHFLQELCGPEGKRISRRVSSIPKELGVDPSREWEAFDHDFGPENPHSHLYGGWFLFCGELVEGLGRQSELGARTFAHWFTTSFPASTLPKEVKLCAVEFLARIPWILPEKPE